MTEQDGVALQAESCRLLLALQPMVAPLMGVTPSAARTRTLTGFAACTPTGVDGLSPPSRTMLSLAAAPKVRALVISEDAPLKGSVTVMFCGPSPCAGAARMIWPALAANCVAVVLPTAALRPVAKPIPRTVTAPPFTPTRAGRTESAYRTCA